MTYKGFVIQMMCGSKCYVVEIEVNGLKKTKRVNARSPVNARKFIRKKYGKETTIHSAVAERNK